MTDDFAERLFVLSLAGAVLGPLVMAATAYFFLWLPQHLVEAQAARDRAARAEAAESARQSLTGTWMLDSAIEDGVALPAEKLVNAKLEIAGSAHTLQVGDLMKGSHYLDPEPTPATIDASYIEGPYRGRTLRGIYEVSADTLRVSFAKPGAERPKEFPRGNIIQVWKRP